MPKTLTLIVALWCCAGPVRADIVSIADWPCATWTERRHAGTQADAPQMWLSGFMTGLATARLVDALAITDAPTVFAWMDDFCSREPEASISSGGIRLFNELSRRLPTTPPTLSDARSD